MSQTNLSWILRIFYLSCYKWDIINNYIPLFVASKKTNVKHRIATIK